MILKWIIITEVQSCGNGLNTSNRLLLENPLFSGNLKVLKGKLEQEATENLGMALFYTLVTLAEEWLSENFSQDTGMEDAEEDESATDDIIVPYGEPVTNDTFLAWHERFEAELALERAKCVS